VRWRTYLGYLGITVAVALVWFALGEISRDEQHAACESGCAWVCGDVYESMADSQACFFQQCERACLPYTRAYEAFHRHRREREFVAWVKQKLGMGDRVVERVLADPRSYEKER
jgi:hypothetical protein